MSAEIFISYASEDGSVAVALCDALEVAGRTCWMASRNIPAGTEYPEAIVAAIVASQAMVVVLSRHTNDSPHVKREVERAVSHDRPVIPYRIESVTPSVALELFLSTTQWVDAFRLPTGQQHAALASAVERALSGSAVPTPRRWRTSGSRKIASAAAVIALTASLAIGALVTNLDSLGLGSHKAAGTLGGAQETANDEFKSDLVGASPAISDVTGFVLPEGVEEESSSVLHPRESDGCDQGYLPFDRTSFRGASPDALPDAAEAWLPGNWFADDGNDSDSAIARKGRGMARFERTGDGTIDALRCYKPFRVATRAPGPYADISILRLSDERTWVQGLISPYDESFGQPEINVFQNLDCREPGLTAFGSHDGTVSNFILANTLRAAEVSPSSILSVRFSFFDPPPGVARDSAGRNTIQTCVNLPP